MNRFKNKCVLLVLAGAMLGIAGVGCKDDTTKPAPPPAPTTPAVPSPGTPPTPKAEATVPGGNASTAIDTIASPSAAAAPLTSVPAAAKGGGERWTGKEISWVRPEGWTQKEGSAMRLATLSAGSGDSAVEIAVTKFPGDVGGKLQNVNRWRGQIGMPPIAEADLAKEAPEVDVAGVKGYIVDFKGDGGKRLLAAALPHGGNTYFLKAGPAPTDAVEKQAAAFRAFVESVRFPAE